MSERTSGEIEAILFAVGDSVEISRIAKAVGISEEDAEDCLLDLMIRYARPESGLELGRFGNKVRLHTKKECYETIRKVVPTPETGRLSQVQLEVLTIVAYRQPVTRAEIEKIRGTDSYGVLSSLLDSELIEEQGRLRKRGSPVLYGTTEKFLQRFNISSIDELRPIDDDAMAEIMDEAEKEADALFRMP